MSQSETVLHRFGGAGDGKAPEASLVNVNGTFCGTTWFGGKDHDGGTVFAISPSGRETVLHSFGAPGDGANPAAGLVAVHGVLYGTTENGGAQGAGVVFAIMPSGTETVLHSFGAAGDGLFPIGDLVDVNGALFGTTRAGGAHAHGTVFSLTPM